MCADDRRRPHAGPDRSSAPAFCRRLDPRCQHLESASSSRRSCPEQSKMPAFLIFLRSLDALTWAASAKFCSFPQAAPRGTTAGSPTPSLQPSRNSARDVIVHPAGMVIRESRNGMSARDPSPQPWPSRENQVVYSSWYPRGVGLSLPAEEAIEIAETGFAGVDLQVLDLVRSETDPAALRLRMDDMGLRGG